MSVHGSGTVELLVNPRPRIRARRRLAPLVRRRRGRALLLRVGLAVRVLGLGQWLELMLCGRLTDGELRAPVYRHTFTPAPPAGPRRRSC